MVFEGLSTLLPSCKYSSTQRILPPVVLVTCWHWIQRRGSNSANEQEGQSALLARTLAFVS